MYSNQGFTNWMPQQRSMPGASGGSVGGGGVTSGVSGSSPGMGGGFDAPVTNFPTQAQAQVRPPVTNWMPQQQPIQNRQTNWGGAQQQPQGLMQMYPQATSGFNPGGGGAGGFNPTTSGFNPGGAGGFNQPQGGGQTNWMPQQPPQGGQTNWQQQIPPNLFNLFQQMFGGR